MLFRNDARVPAITWNNSQMFKPSLDYKVRWQIWRDQRVRTLRYILLYVNYISSK